MYKQWVYFKHTFMESETSLFACHILMCPFHQLTETASRNLARKWQLANSNNSWGETHPFSKWVWTHLESPYRWAMVTLWPCQGCWWAAGSKHREQDFHRHSSRCPAGLHQNQKVPLWNIFIWRIPTICVILQQKAEMFPNQLYPKQCEKRIYESS